MGCLADPPHIEDSDQTAELSLTPGTPLELHCNAQGTPQPNITWHKDGQALSRPEDSNRAGQALRVEGVQVLLPRCSGRRLAVGRGAQWHLAKLAKLLLCVGWAHGGVPPGPCPQELPAGNEPKLTQKPDNPSSSLAREGWCRRAVGLGVGAFLEEAGLALALKHG